MGKNAVSIRIDEEKIEVLNELAKANKRDRSFVINEAIDLYLDMNEWQIERIKAGVKQADQGKFAKAPELSKAIKRWQK